MNIKEACPFTAALLLLLYIIFTSQLPPQELLLLYKGGGHFLSLLNEVQGGRGRVGGTQRTAASVQPTSEFPIKRLAVYSKSIDINTPGRRRASASGFPIKKNASPELDFLLSAEYQISSAAARL